MPKHYQSLSSQQLVDSLLSGAVGVLATDTLYGVVCLAADQSAVARLYQLKKREQKPGTIIAANCEQLVGLGFKARYLKAIEHYWPGPVSIIIPCTQLAYLHLGAGGVAVRLSADHRLNDLISKVGPLLTTSANLPGRTPATTIEQAQQYFGEAVDFYVDGGNLSDRHPSTIIRVIDDAVEVLRAGAVKIDGETGKVLT